MKLRIAECLCRLPVAFKAHGNISMSALLRESGYTKTDSQVSEQDIEACLRDDPSLVGAWLAYSEDQRCSPAWYLARPGAGLDGREGWRVGDSDSGRRLPERAFPNEFAACAFFVSRFIDGL